MIVIGFVYRFVPETKGRSVEEITQISEQETARGISASAAAGAAWPGRPAAEPWSSPRL